MSSLSSLPALAGPLGGQLPGLAPLSGLAAPLMSGFGGLPHAMATVPATRSIRPQQPLLMRPAAPAPGKPALTQNPSRAQAPATPQLGAPAQSALSALPTSSNLPLGGTPAAFPVLTGQATPSLTSLPAFSQLAPLSSATGALPASSALSSLSGLAPMASLLRF
jgi:hypothetical protein